MPYLGKVFNKALAKEISVYHSDTGSSFKRFDAGTSQNLKEAALAKIKGRFENGSVFNNDDME